MGNSLLAVISTRRPSQDSVSANAELARWIRIRLRPFPRSTKTPCVSPDAVQDHSDLAGNSNARLLRSNALGQPCPPSFEWGPTLHLREKDIGGLVQARSSEPISAFRAPPHRHHPRQAAGGPCRPEEGHRDRRSQRIGSETLVEARRMASARLALPIVKFIEGGLNSSKVD